MFAGICDAEIRVAVKSELIGAWRGKLDITQGGQVQEFQSIILFDGKNVTMIEKIGGGSKSNWHGGQYEIEQGELKILVKGRVKDTMIFKYNDEIDCLIMIDGGQEVVLHRMIPK